MNTFLIIIGILAIIAGIIVPIILKSIEENRRYREPGYGRHVTRDEQPVAMTKKSILSIWSFLIIIGIFMLILGNSFEIIPTGYTGVRTTFGQIDEQTVPQGFVWKIPFVQDIHRVNNKQQDARFNSEVWGETAAETKRIAAEAEAEATLIDANAEAEANAKIRDSLSDAILKFKFYEIWDGKLPSVMGSDAVIADITGGETILP